MLESDGFMEDQDLFTTPHVRSFCDGCMLWYAYLYVVLAFHEPMGCCVRHFDRFLHNLPAPKAGIFHQACIA